MNFRSANRCLNRCSPAVLAGDEAIELVLSSPLLGGRQQSPGDGAEKRRRPRTRRP